MACCLLRGLGLKKGDDPGFAFNDIDFSDKVLRIEIVPDFCGKIFMHRPRIISLNISSRILAAESLFFYKLFENGTKNKHQNEVSLRIYASEESSLMDLLNFMYINTLSATTYSELLGVKKVAEKFEVISCIKYLQKTSISSKSELGNGEPSSVIKNEEIQSLQDAAKKFLAEQFKDFDKYNDEAMALPLSALEVVLGSDGLQVRTEDDVFTFIFRWAKAHYPCRHDEILYKRLFRLIYFPYLCIETLRKQFTPTKKGSPNEPMNHISYRVLEGVHFNSGYLYSNHVPQDPQGPQITNLGVVLNRVYKYHPIKVMQYNRCYQHRCVVYFNLTKQHLKNLFPSKQQYCRSFCIWGRMLFLSAECNKVGSSYHFGLFVIRDIRTTCCTFGYEFAVLMRNYKSEEYQSKYKVKKCTLMSNVKERDGINNLFGMSWTDFMADDSEYFINGILHLRAEITLINDDNSRV